MREVAPSDKPTDNSHHTLQLLLGLWSFYGILLLLVSVLQSTTLLFVHPHQSRQLKCLILSDAGKLIGNILDSNRRMNIGSIAGWKRS